MHGMTLLSFRLFRKNLGNLREFFGQMVHRPPGEKIAHTPMGKTHRNREVPGGSKIEIRSLLPYFHVSIIY